MSSIRFGMLSVLVSQFDCVVWSDSRAGTQSDTSASTIDGNISQHGIMANIKVNLWYHRHKDAKRRTKGYLEAGKGDNVTSTGLSNKCSYFKRKFGTKPSVCQARDGNLSRWHNVDCRNLNLGRGHSGIVQDSHEQSCQSISDTRRFKQVIFSQCTIIGVNSKLIDITRPKATHGHFLCLKRSSRETNILKHDSSELNGCITTKLSSTHALYHVGRCDANTQTNGWNLGSTLNNASEHVLKPRTCHAMNETSSFIFRCSLLFKLPLLFELNLLLWERGRFGGS
mmetsp:Transcript_6538/g.11920  ORF Transcript_6538/g.11920 Transcript_6538/m.11920 type:complete len:283 (+) Transcript_6538:215-1063(+)